MSKFYISSDYAGVSGGTVSFYYGYEETHFDEWCFVVKEGNTETARFPSSVLGVRDKFDVSLCLLAGIGKWLDEKDSNAAAMKREEAK